MYKPPLPLDSAMTVIARGRGKQYDPLLVDLFLACRDDVAAILAEHPDR